MQTASETLDDAVGRLFTLDESALSDPFPIYQRLREEAPVYQYGPVVVLSRWDDLEMVFGDPDRFANAQVRGSSRVESTAAALSPADRELFYEIVDFEAHMLFMSDPPNHTRLRALTGRAFTPRRVAGLHGEATELLAGMLDAADGDGTIEAVEDFAFDFPLYLMCNMLGSPPEDRQQIKGWAQSFGSFIGANYSSIEEVHTAISDWRVYVRDLIDRARANPHEGTLLTALVQAEEDGDRLSYPELEALVVNMFFAGHETSSNLIMNGLVTLLRHPDQFQMLRDDPTLLPLALEEIARYSTSVHTLHRVATRDTEIGGVPVPAKQTVRLLLASGNRDDAHVPDPDRFDITRTDQRNLTFGRGVHFCIGASLARMELTVTLEQFCTRYASVLLASDEVRFRSNLGLRGPERLPLRVSR